MLLFLLKTFHKVTISMGLPIPSQQLCNQVKWDTLIFWRFGLFFGLLRAFFFFLFFILFVPLLALLWEFWSDDADNPPPSSPFTSFSSYFPTPPLFILVLLAHIERFSGFPYAKFFDIKNQQQIYALKVSQKKTRIDLVCLLLPFPTPLPQWDSLAYLGTKKKAKVIWPSEEGITTSYQHCNTHKNSDRELFVGIEKQSNNILHKTLNLIWNIFVFLFLILNCHIQTRNKK